jgi:hypothetical protein
MRHAYPNPGAEQGTIGLTKLFQIVDGLFYFWTGKRSAVDDGLLEAMTADGFGDGFLKRRYWTYGGLLVFYAAGFILLLHHEPWRDEVHEWLVARSAGFEAMVQQAAYDGHPILWDLVLWPFARAGLPVFTLQVVHLLFAAGTAWLIVFRSPFSALEKVLLCAGYYFFYEYQIISRQYAVFSLLLFWTASRPKTGNPWHLAVPLALISQTCIQGLLVCLSLGFLLLRSKEWKADARKRGIVLLLGSSALLAVIQLIPTADSANRPGWNLGPWAGWMQTFQQMATYAFCPIPQARVQFWNSNLVFEAWPYLGLIFILVPLALGWSRRLAWFYYFNLLSFVLLGHLKWVNLSRHCGLIFVVFVFAAWLARDEKSEFFSSPSLLPSKVALFVLLLFLQVPGSVIAGSYDFKYPFTGAKYAAGTLTRLGVSDKDFIAVCDGWRGSALLGYLAPGVERLFFVQCDEFRTYMVSSQKCSEPVSAAELVRRMERASQGYPADRKFLVLSETMDAWYWISREKDFQARFELISSYPPSRWLVNGSDENFSLYRLR